MYKRLSQLFMVLCLIQLLLISEIFVYTFFIATLSYIAFTIWRDGMKLIIETKEEKPMRLSPESEEKKAIIYPLPFVDNYWYHNKSGEEITVTQSAEYGEYYVTDPPQYAGNHILIRDVREL